MRGSDSCFRKTESGDQSQGQKWGAKKPEKSPYWSILTVRDSNDKGLDLGTDGANGESGTHALWQLNFM